MLKCLVESTGSLTVMVYASSLGWKCYHVRFLHGGVARRLLAFLSSPLYLGRPIFLDTFLFESCDPFRDFQTCP